jgi:hypothetical protein
MKWIKFYCEKWFLGSTRWELSPEERAVWVDCLAKAGLNDPSGQINYYSLQQLADQFKVPLTLVETCLAKFQTENKITHNIINKIIKILKWRDFQSEYCRQKLYRQGFTGVTKSNIKKRKKVTRRLEVEVDKNKNTYLFDLKEKEKAKRTKAPLNGEKDNTKKRIKNLEGRFGEFYSAYPRHIGRQEALKAWLKLSPDDSLVERILVFIGEAKNSDEWKKDNGQFIPYPSTFLNDRRWEDELTFKKDWRD